MTAVTGAFRLFSSGLVLVTAALAVMITYWLPFRLQGYRPSFLVLGAFVRRLLRVLNIEVICQEPEKLRHFSGFIFPNHVSYVDILALLAVTPVRFLAKDDVRKMPFIGQIARAIGCVFVERTDKSSRQAARITLAHMNYHPPIVLFPEGQRGDGTTLLPFRYGAFEIATDVGAAISPCTITYSRLEATIWHRRENIGRALWRLARERRPIQVEITLLPAFQPAPGTNPVQLSEILHEEMTAVWCEHQLPQID